MRYDLVIISLLSLLAFHLQPWSQNEKDVVTTQEYEVYNTYLNEITQHPDTGKDIRLLVISDHTIPLSSSCSPTEIAKYKYNEGIVSDQLKPLFEDLRAKNNEPVALRDLFKLSRQHALIDASEFAAYFKKDDVGAGWDSFYKKYPDSSGFIRLSRVGFNSDFTKAVIFARIYCGTLCGSGDYILFEKKSGEWRIVKDFNCWIS